MKTSRYMTMVLLSLMAVLAMPVVAAPGAKVLMQLVPDEVPVGKEFTAVIRIKNTGSTTWSTAAGVYLASLKTQPWDLYRTPLPSDAPVAPGETITFKPEIMAPLIPGEYLLQWQMRQWSTLFGEPTVPVKVRVTGSMIPFTLSEFVYQNVPAVMVVGETYTVTLQYKNIGDTVWTPNQFSLISLVPSAALTWAVDEVDIKTKAVVPPGGFQTFRFDVVAPAEPGVYPFEWKMNQKGSGSFGKPSKRLEIKVVGGP